MKQLFAVIRSHGSAWQLGCPLEKQARWEAHRQFMNELEAQGFVLLGGPWGADDALLIFRATSADEIEQRLKADPWSDDLLRTTRVDPLDLRIGSIA